ncbi:MAG: type II secretion system protein [Proteobacteria bacterium]|nr:type II secretion system protein [Pseudomonadota bacterium]
MKNPTTPDQPVRPRSLKQGFTLLEVLLAVMILAISVTAILSQFSVGMEAGGKARDITEAVLHAKEKLEEFKAFIDNGEGGQSGAFDDGYTWEALSSVYELPEKETGVSENELSFDLLQLTVIVRWDTGAQARQVELSTLKAVKKKDKG